MSFRKCSAGHEIEIHYYPYDISISAQMDNPDKPYCVVVAGQVIAECDTLLEADGEYLGVCTCNHEEDQPIQGRMQIGKHKLEGSQVKVVE